MFKIPSSVPAVFTDVETKQQYTSAKLKVFYEGETPDHRLFTKDFSEKVVKTLPLTPVVGFYSEEKEDFVGHNDIQYIYGVVPDTAEINFEEDDNKQTWAVTDVVLYTERDDNISEVAKKIVGKQHSLELNPKTLKYKINRDANGKFKNIQFTEGQFVGLSVLGDNETPAFKGSGFFTENKDFNEIAAQCKEGFDEFINLLNTHGGNITVFNKENFFSQLAEKFASITMQEFQEKIYTALSNQNRYGYLVENTEDYAIVHEYDAVNDKYVYNKIALALDADGNIVLGDSVEVVVKYLTQDEIDSLNPSTDSNAVANAECGDDEEKKKDDVADAACGGDGDEEDKKKDEAIASLNGEGVDQSLATATTDENANAAKKDDESDPKSTEGASDDDEENGDKDPDDDEEEKTGKMAASASSASASALSDEERTELENYRRAEKNRLIDSYVGDLAAETIKQYKDSVDSFTYADLEAKLAIEFRNFKIAHKDDNNTQKIINVFGVVGNQAENYNEYNPADVIKKHGAQ